MLAFITSLQNSIHHFPLPVLFIIGIITLIGLYFGKTMKYIKLPSIIGFMIIGVILGPSLLNIIDHHFQENLSFITEIALGFVALSIGLELSFNELKKQGKSIIFIIFSESFLAFIVVTLFIYFFVILTKIPNHLAWPLALIFGSIAPASAPAGTVAIIKEFNARGSLTKALYSVVGFDDGLGIIIFGFASVIAKSILSSQSGNHINIISLISAPLLEIGFSLIIGIIGGLLFSLLVRKLSLKKDMFILIFAFIFIITGLCKMLHLSLILTNMIVGIVIVNALNMTTVHKIGEELSNVMPLLFILFFVFAGANLHVLALPSLGLLGLVYIIGRTSGLMSGAWIGATIGKAEPKIKKYLGMGILSQAGVAIGLALIVKQEFAELGMDHSGQIIGTMVITTVTATCIIFEIIGPILTKIGLEKAGEINTHH
jgi:Kef-type K+ transport system membrane component KefB